MKYPGHVIKVGEADSQVVEALKRALNAAMGLTQENKLALDVNDPAFGPKMKQLIQLYQSRHVDQDGIPLKVDGEVGSLTWAALFGQSAVPSHDVADITSPLLRAVLDIASSQVGVKEDPRNSNRGPKVDEYLDRAGVDSGLAWCCAFVYWCFDEGASRQKVPNPMYRTAGCLAHWNKAESVGAERVPTAQAAGNPALVTPGMVFVMSHGGGLGHTGFVESVAGGMMTTIEGNTDASQTREGGGVYRLRRKINSVNKGFIRYAVADP